VLPYATIALRSAWVRISANSASYDDEPAAKPAPAAPAAQNEPEPIQAQPAAEPINDASANAPDAHQGQDEMKQDIKEESTGDAYMGGGGWNGPGPGRGGGGGGGGGDDGYGPINVKEDG